MLSVSASTQVNKNKPKPYFSRLSCVFEVFWQSPENSKNCNRLSTPSQTAKNINVSDIQNTPKQTSDNDFHGRAQLRAE